MKSFATKFKEENAGKWVWYNGAMGLYTALVNNYIEKTREIAVREMASRDEVPFDFVDNNYRDWYYIVPVEEIEDEYLNEYADKYLS